MRTGMFAVGATLAAGAVVMTSVRHATTPDGVDSSIGTEMHSSRQSSSPPPDEPAGEMKLLVAFATPALPGHWSEVYLGFDNTSLVPFQVTRMESSIADRARIVHADGSYSPGLVIPARRFFMTGLGFRLRLDGIHRRLSPGDTLTIALIGPHGRLNVEVRVREVAADRRQTRNQPLGGSETRT